MPVLKSGPSKSWLICASVGEKPGVVSGIWVCATLRVPFLQIDNARTRAELFEQAEATARLCELRDAAGRVTQIAEDDDLRRARLGAGRLNLTVAHASLLVLGRVLRAAYALHAEGALLHDAARAERDIRVELLVQRARPLGCEPREIAHRVWTVVRTEAGSDAAVVDLRV